MSFWHYTYRNHFLLILVLRRGAGPEEDYLFQSTDMLSRIKSSWSVVVALQLK